MQIKNSTFDKIFHFLIIAQTLMICIFEFFCLSINIDTISFIWYMNSEKYD
jgi:hypothetical protein